jgi:ABC-2 type transport system ATP-binding protein
MPDAIAASRVTKAFGRKVAVDSLDLRVESGSLCGFIGPNGAGKTTTIRMIMSILLPDAGDISVLGFPSALDAKDRIGYLPEERGIYKKMKVGAFLRHMGRLKGVPDRGLEGRVKSWLEALELPEVFDKKCEELSKGMQQKVQFIACVLHEPDLLILDEPFSGLDPVNMRLVRDLILEQHQRGATIVFSTHVMAQAEQLCDRVVMIDRGHKVLDESLSGIRDRFDPRVVILEPMERGGDTAALRRVAGIRSVEPDGAAWKLLLTDDADPAAVLRAIVAAVPPARVELHRPTLEDVFVQMVQRSGAGRDGHTGDTHAGLAGRAAESGRA